MSDPQLVLGDRVQRALAAAFGAEYADADPVIRPSQFADYQANVALAAGQAARPAAARRWRPRWWTRSTSTTSARAVEISGPGFINLTLRDDWLAARAADAARRPAARRARGRHRQVVPIDYSAPNVAKEMHVGHLRTTVIGDALARTLEFLGHHVIRQNHIGDWGTPFGMLIEHLLDVGEDSAEAGLLESRPERLLPGRPRASSTATRTFADRARRRVVLLQGGDAETLRLWQRARRPVEALLQPGLRRARRHAHRRRPRRREHRTTRCSAEVCDELEAAGHRDDERRRAVRVPRRLHRPRGQAAAADHPQERRRVRLRHDRPGRDPLPGARPARRPHRSTSSARRSRLHLRMVFAAARKAGWLPDDVEAVHVADRQRARRRPQDAQDPQRRADPADVAARRGRRAGARRGRTSTRPELDAETHARDRPQSSASAR